MQSRVLFLTSNGSGLGHLTRSMAIARRLPPRVRPVVLTLSQALPVAVQQGYHVEYLMSPGYASLPTADWNRLYERRVLHALDLYDPAVVVFDGTFPYSGLRQAIAARRELLWVWCRRAMWKPSDDDRAVQHSGVFDVIVEPGELAAEADRGLTAARRSEVTCVAPITLLDPDDLLPRSAAAAELGLAPDGVNVLVQLGAGNVNDISSEVGMVVDRLRRWSGAEVVIAESLITGVPLPLPEDVHRARTYPVTRLARAFDITVTATGYNSFHEAIAFGLPALWVPNEHTAMDDQAARAAYAERLGIGVCWTPRTSERLDAALSTLGDVQARDRMVEGMARLRTDNGAEEAASLVADLVAERAGSRA